MKMKFGRILVQLLTNVLTYFFLCCEEWKIIPGLFMNWIKLEYNAICYFSVDDVYHLC